MMTARWITVVLLFSRELGTRVRRTRLRFKPRWWTKMWFIKKVVEDRTGLDTAIFFLEAFDNGRWRHAGQCEKVFSWMRAPTPGSLLIRVQKKVTPLGYYAQRGRL